MQRIALVSTGPLSGKTTLAHYLQQHEHFIIACHICTLVESFVEKENSTNYPYHEFTMRDVFSNKEFYRPALQDHALAVGFHDEDMLGYWIERTIAKATQTQDSSTLLRTQGLVFDPIRGAAQAQYLRDTGWTIVQLQISENERARRAEAMGKDYESIVQAMQRHPDIERGINFADIVLDGEKGTGETALHLLELAKEIEHDRQSPALEAAE